MYIYKTNSKLYVSSPYNETFLEHARILNGKWKLNKTWEFNVNQEAAVLNAVLQSYGTIPDKSVIGRGTLTKKEILNQIEYMVNSNKRPLNCKIDQNGATIYQVGEGISVPHFNSRSIRFELQDKDYLVVTIDLVELNGSIVINDVVTAFEDSRNFINGFVGSIPFEKVTISLLETLLGIIDGSIFPHDTHFKFSPYFKGMLSEFLRWDIDRDNTLYRGIEHKRIFLEDKYGNRLTDWKIKEIQELLEFNNYKIHGIRKVKSDNKETEVILCDGFVVNSNGVAYAY